MKVCSKVILGNSYCYHRIITALHKYAPSWVEFVEAPRQSDVSILHVNGRFHHFMSFVEDFKKHGGKYVVAQYCIRSTQKRRTKTWRALWENALMVWSYYDLNGYIKEEGGDWTIPNFFHSPLGADETIFNRAGNENKDFIAMTSGNSASLECESVSNVFDAAKITGNKVFHLGPKLIEENHVFYDHGISDEILASRYRQCHFVSGLRRVEGFEMPAVEGLFSGCRPILYDRPHYSQWYKPWAILIPEDNNVTASLVKIFNDGPKPITNDEIGSAIEQFSWKNIVTEFWERLK